MSVVTELTLAVAIVVLFLWLLNNFNRNKHFYKDIPGPPALPLIGNVLEFTSTTKMLNSLHKYSKKYGGIYKVQIGPVRRFIVVTDYKFLEFILSSTKLLTKSDDYKFLRPWLGTGLLTSDDFPGHDTTASAISFSLYCLANHPHIQAKAFDEQQSIMSSKASNVVTIGDLQNMKYLDQVIKETLRLYPSVPVYLREINQEVEFNGVKLPQGDALTIFAFGIHRNPEYFKNPEEFNPDRFEDIDGRLPYAYIPFSAGPRDCIGQKFAMLEMKSTIAKILRNFELKPATPQHVLELCVDSVLKSVNGVKIKLEQRKWENKS